MKGKIVSFLIISIISVALFISFFAKKEYSSANKVYQVYLNGEKIGLLNNDDELYDLINEKQLEIKKKYNVKKVYPPNGFNIVKSYTFDEKVNDVDEIYKQIENVDDFTIKGYTITIHKPKDGEINPVNDVNDDLNEFVYDSSEDIVINVLDKKTFEEALLIFVYSFVGEENYNNYINGTQPEIKDTGKIIQNLYFKEQITIKENLISVKEKIYTDSKELSQYLLFGSDKTEELYTIKQGDTIASVSDKHKLNTQEFLVANPKYRNEDSLLTIGDSVSIALIKPVISIVAEMYSIEDVEQYFEKQVVYDENKPSSYSKVTQNGINGITRITQIYNSVNGEDGQGTVVNKEVIREKVNQITTKGKKQEYIPISGNYIDTGGTWAWPTNSGYKITSNFAWRWGKMHEGIDIAYLPLNSPIYAAGDGVVTAAQTGTGSFWSAGKYVVIRHDNNIYTLYAHLNTISVRPGQVVSKGTVVGGMGQTGYATGVHLHFSVFNGEPYHGGKVFNPMSLYR